MATIESIYKEVAQICLGNNIKLGVAESCTGGYISKVITDIPGSSKFFVGGIISYSNEVKVKILGVKSKTLRAYGAVSYETAKEMVKGVRRILKTDISVAVTGIAGPTGGSIEKPVGTVYIGIDIKGGTNVYKYHFKGVRDSVRKQSVKKVGEMICGSACKLQN